MTETLMTLSRVRNVTGNLRWAKPALTNKRSGDGRKVNFRSFFLFESGHAFNSPFLKLHHQMRSNFQFTSNLRTKWSDFTLIDVKFDFLLRFVTLKSDFERLLDNRRTFAVVFSALVGCEITSEQKLMLFDWASLRPYKKEANYRGQ